MGAIAKYMRSFNLVDQTTTIKAILTKPNTIIGAVYGSISWLLFYQRLRYG